MRMATLLCLLSTKYTCICCHHHARRVDQPTGPLLSSQLSQTRSSRQHANHPPPRSLPAVNHSPSHTHHGHQAAGHATRQNAPPSCRHKPRPWQPCATRYFALGSLAPLHQPQPLLPPVFHGHSTKHTFLPRRCSLYLAHMPVLLFNHPAVFHLPEIPIHSPPSATFPMPRMPRSSASPSASSHRLVRVRRHRMLCQCFTYPPHVLFFLFLGFHNHHFSTTPLDLAATRLPVPGFCS